MSITSAGLTKCESCGHWVTKGRLTCQNCGAVADIQKPVSNIDFYKSISRGRAREYNEFLRDLNNWALACDSIMVSNIAAEIHQSDFKIFRDIVSINIPITGRWGRIEGHYQKLNEDIRLFKTNIYTETGSFTRFVAIEDDSMYICEVSEEANEYLSEIIYELNLEQKIKEAPERIRRIKQYIVNCESEIEIDTENLKIAEKKLRELVENAESRRKASRFDRLFMSRVSEQELDTMRRHVRNLVERINDTKETLEDNKRGLEKLEKLLEENEG